jgi:uncharacterized protein YcfL
MQFIHSSSLLLLLTLLTACSSKSSSEELTKELQTVSSWTATAETVTLGYAVLSQQHTPNKRSLQHSKNCKKKQVHWHNYQQHPPSVLLY